MCHHDHTAAIRARLAHLTVTGVIGPLLAAVATAIIAAVGRSGGPAPGCARPHPWVLDALLAAVSVPTLAFSLIGWAAGRDPVDTPEPTMMTCPTDTVSVRGWGCVAPVAADDCFRTADDVRAHSGETCGRCAYSAGSHPDSTPEPEPAPDPDSGPGWDREAIQELVRLAREDALSDDPASIRRIWRSKLRPCSPTGTRTRRPMMLPSVPPTGGTPEALRYKTERDEARAEPSAPATMRESLSRTPSAGSSTVAKAARPAQPPAGDTMAIQVSDDERETVHRAVGCSAGTGVTELTVLSAAPVRVGGGLATGVQPGETTGMLRA